MSSYVYDQGWSEEQRRLSALALIYDPGSFRLLRQLGVSEGYHCLEVGAGEGSVARWLANEVGPSGRVVAVDLDPRFTVGMEGVESHQHDILTGPPEVDAFDLVHARAVVEWIADRPAALRNMVAALKPGGTLLVEDVDLVTAGLTAPPSEAHERVVRAFAAFASRGGADLYYGRTLPRDLAESGLINVGTDVRTVWQRGQEATTDFQRLTLRQMREPLVACGLITEEDSREFDRALDDPAISMYPPLMVAAWGYRPGG